MNSLVKALVFFSKRTDLIVAIIVLTAIVIMIIPLPTTLVDALIAINIGASVLILMVAFAIIHPTEFTTLPSVILIATLFRLAITITTSRLILLQANAGDVVNAFGHFVVGGNAAVGLIIFLIITTAQFLVITKGSERVAEVAARFTLDALPGKQMSIDSDLRNGDIDQAEARRLRKQLERESQLYGAMDGAMKFVKGDAMAGLVIILVNLAGGLAIGTIQRGLSMSEAAHKYLLLTVGDGLIAQIPALLVSVAAGTVITRVSSEEQNILGAELGSQLFGQARTLLLTALVMALLAFMPGFPTYVFLALAAAFATVGMMAGRREPVKQRQAAKTAQAVRADGKPVARADAKQADKRAAEPGKSIESDEDPQKIYPLTLRLGNDLGQAIDPSLMRESIGEARTSLFNDLGVQAPEVGYRQDARLTPNRFSIDLDGVPVSEGDIEAHSVLVENNIADLELMKIPYKIGHDIPEFPRAILVGDQHTEALSKAGIRYYTLPEILGICVSRVLERYATQFVGIQETRQLLAPIETEYPDLVKETQKVLTLQKVNEILRRLLAEKISIANMRPILEALVEWAHREDDVVLLTEYVRGALARHICFRCADRNRVIAAYLLERQLEESIRSSVRATSVGAYLTVSEDIAHLIVEQIWHSLQMTSPGFQPVILTSMDVRRHVRNLLIRNGIDVPVLSYQELAPEFSVQTLGTILASPSPGLGEPPALTESVGRAEELGV
jgi:type III secretion protein V